MEAVQNRFSAPIKKEEKRSKLFALHMGINLYVGGLFLACQKLCEVYIFHLEVIESQEN